jgi:hypothetical protein
MTPEQVSAKEIYTMLQLYLHGRPDLGFANAIAVQVLESRNPFEPKSFPRLQRWFVLVLLVASASAGAFAYFNFWH